MRRMIGPTFARIGCAVNAMCIVGVFVGQPLLTRASVTFTFVVTALYAAMVPVIWHASREHDEDVRDLMQSIGAPRETPEEGASWAAFPVSYFSVAMAAAYAYRELYLPFSAEVLLVVMAAVMWRKKKQRASE